MLIILEGPNGAGKTTIADRLAPDVLLHAGPPTQATAYDEWVEPLIEHVGLDELIVLDRWHLGEAIYPDLLTKMTGVKRNRIATDLELGQISRTISAMFASYCRIAYVLPPIDLLRERFQARGNHWQIGLAQAEAAHGRYLELISDRMHDNMPYTLLSSQASVDAFVAQYGPADS